MRYTEYHFGKAVIKNKNLLPEAIEKLARIEDYEDLPATICDHYCKWTNIAPSQEYLDAKCKGCDLEKLFELLT